MRRDCLLLLVLSVLVACVIATPTRRANGSIQDDSTPVSYVYFPAVCALEPPTPTPTETPTETPTPTTTPTPIPTCDPSQIDWDPRLDQRGAVIIPADVQPGEWYWRLVKGVWYAEHEQPFDGQHHIFIDTHNQAGARQTGVPVKITSLDGSIVWQTLITELKPGELYAANFPMYRTAPAYRAVPAGGSPADAVSNLGMGCIERPWEATHTSYGFVWQWTQAAEATPEPPATGTPTPTPESATTGESAASLHFTFRR